MRKFLRSSNRSGGGKNEGKNAEEATKIPLLFREPVGTFKEGGRERGCNCKEAGTSHGGSSGASSQGRGPLNSSRQLETAYAKLLTNEGANELWRKEVFQQVRILVLGRSGAGKTTLIRLMVGKDGPQTVSDGIPGVQDINKEFLYSSEQQGVPLIIHDSNGMDVGSGQERVNEIKAFLDKRQKAEDFSERIHLLWYVISAIDSRCVDDGDVMQMISGHKIPTLLIVTHNDYDKVKLTDDVLNMLLQRVYSTEDERKGIKQLMVRVANDGVSRGADNEFIIDESKRDRDGLKLVAKRTLQLIDKKLKYTWIAAQSVDVDGKLEESAGIAVGYARKALFTSLPQVIPFTDPLMLTIIFHRIMVILCQIWMVPRELNAALKETLLEKEANARVLRRLGEDLVYAAGLAATVAAAVLTGGAALPAVIVALAASGILSIASTAPMLVNMFALQVLGTILYVKSSQVGSGFGWKRGVSKEEYLELCEEFAHNAEYQALLVNFAKQDHSKLDLALDKKKVKAIMKSKAVDMYRRLLRDRPNSLRSRVDAEISKSASRNSDHLDHQRRTKRRLYHPSPGSITQ